jgi:hypothetical protein
LAFSRISGSLSRPTYQRRSKAVNNFHELRSFSARSFSTLLREE